MTTHRFNYEQAEVPTKDGATFEYHQVEAPIGRSHRSGRYKHLHPPQRRLSDALPPLNVVGKKKVSEEVVARMEDDYAMGLEENEEFGADVVARMVWAFGTDLNGRRRIEAFMQKLDPDTRRRREVHLAEYAGFRMRRDGTLDYDTSVSVMKQGKKWCKLM